MATDNVTSNDMRKLNINFSDALDLYDQLTLNLSLIRSQLRVIEDSSEDKPETYSHMIGNLAHTGRHLLNIVEGDIDTLWNQLKGASDNG